MNVLEAFGAIFTGIWLFISSPMVMMLLGVVLMIFGIILTLSALFVPHEGRSELWERLSAWVAGLLITITGLAIIIWAGSSSADGFTWGLQ